jgi:hypothetical protein
MLSIPFYEAQSVVGHAFLRWKIVGLKLLLQSFTSLVTVLKQLILGQSTALFGEKKHTLSSA